MTYQSSLERTIRMAETWRCVKALWEAGNDTHDIATALFLHEADVARIVAALRDQARSAAQAPQSETDNT